MGSRHYPTKSKSNLNRYSQILARSQQIWPDLARFGQILAQVIKPEIDPIQLENERPKLKNPTKSFGLVSSHFFIHSNHSGRVRVGHKPNLWTTLTESYKNDTFHSKRITILFVHNESKVIHYKSSTFTIM